MFKSIGIFLLALIMLSLSVSQPVGASRSPVDCNSNRLTLSITRDKLVVQNGDLLTYTVTASNVDAGSSLACNLDNATVTVTLPALDGTATGQVVTITTNASFPAGTAYAVIGSVPYTVNVNNGVVDAIAEVEMNGVLHDAPTDHAANITKTIGTSIVYPIPPTTPPTAPPTPGSAISLPGMPNTAVTTTDNES